jgi:inorganic phosphate transporter, PiT family
VLGEKFFAPLLLSPVLAIFVTVALYRVLTAARQRLKIDRKSCVCVVSPASALQTFGVDQAAYVANAALALPQISVCKTDRIEYVGAIAGVRAQAVVKVGHLLSAFSLCFARALNDTPKLVGLIVVWKALDVRQGMLMIAIAMAIGGALGAAKVAATMSQKISAMNDGQALTANFVSAVLVIAASKFGLPVSTTHVTVSAISGIGLANGSADFTAIKKILASWLLTLPLAALLAAVLASVGRWL